MLLHSSAKDSLRARSAFDNVAKNNKQMIFSVCPHGAEQFDYTRSRIN